MDRTGGNQIPQNVTGADGWQLIRIPNEKNLAVTRDSFSRDAVRLISNMEHSSTTRKSHQGGFRRFS